MQQNEFIDFLKKAVEAGRNLSPRFLGSAAVVLILAIVGLIYWGQVRAQNGEASALMLQGFRALESGRYAQAAQIFGLIETEYTLSRFRKDAPFYHGVALFGLEQYEKAEKLFREFARTNPSSDLAPLALANAAGCREALGDAAAALEEYQQILRSYPDSYLDHYLKLNVARLSETQGNTQTATHIYKDILASDTNNLWFEIARSNLRLVAVEAETEGNDRKTPGPISSEPSAVPSSAPALP